MRCVAKRLPDVALERLHPVGDEALAVDLEEKMRTAAQVEAEHHLPLRQPGRPRRDRLGGEEVRDASRRCRRRTTRRMSAIFQRWK